MKISVKVIAKAKQEKVVSLPNGTWKIWVRALPERGRANERIKELLAAYFHRPKVNIRIIQGQRSANKLIEII